MNSLNIDTQIPPEEQVLRRVSKKFKIFIILLVLTFLSVTPALSGAFPIIIPLLDFIPIERPILGMFGGVVSLILFIPLIINFIKLRIAIKTSGYNFEVQSVLLSVVAILLILFIPIVAFFDITEVILLGGLLFSVLFIIIFIKKIKDIKQIDSFFNRKLAFYNLISSTFFSAIIPLILLNLFISLFAIMLIGSNI